VTDGLEEPELVIEHLLAIDSSDFGRFRDGRIDGPYSDCEEETLLQHEEELLNLPEARAIMDFGRTEFGLDDDWARQLVHDCTMFQPNALIEKESWVMSVLRSERFGKIHFRTIDQVERFRELGNRLYLALPNPVFKGWKPTEIGNAPALLDDIPASAEEIPDSRAAMDKIFAPFWGRERAGQQLLQFLSEKAPKRKIGRNEPCPCGSGKKYKKCCGRKQMNG
jgi:hypothetical protein